MRAAMFLSMAAVAACAVACTGPDGGASTDAPSPPETRRIVGYFTAWSIYERDYHVADIPADQLTHVNYAFAEISATGECTVGDAYADVQREYPGDPPAPGALRGSFHQLALLKARHPHLRTLISVGGWDGSRRFSAVAASDAGRRRFAASCVDFMRRYGFDGVDVDWEYPVGGGRAPGRPDDRGNYTRLLAALRDELDAAGAAAGGVRYLLTAAVPAKPELMAHLELAEIPRHVDWLNLTSYDFHGGWEHVTGLNAPLRAPGGRARADRGTVAAAIDGYLAAGVPADKIVMGVPFYGRGWIGVRPTATRGLFEPATGVPPGSHEAGVFDYADLAARYRPRMERHWCDEAQVPWLYDPASGLMISYDDPVSIRRKVAFARERQLGGVMFWEMAADDGTLVDALQSIR